MFREIPVIFDPVNLTGNLPGNLREAKLPEGRKCHKTKQNGIKFGYSTCRNFSRRREQNILAETGHAGLGIFKGLEEGLENFCSDSGGSVHLENLVVEFGAEAVEIEVQRALTGTTYETVAAVAVTVEHDEEAVAAAVEII